MLRKRRIASDEAHAWARNLRLANHHAKSVLCALSLYIDGEGCCFVGIEQLAADIELSPNTVRRRLAWLEQIGAIERRPQWIDQHGHRGAQGPGKRTTDLVKLLLDGDPADIEARATGKFSPPSLLGLNGGCNHPVSPPVSPAAAPPLALQQPSHCGEGLISSNLNPNLNLNHKDKAVDNSGGKQEQPSGRTKPPHCAQGRGWVWFDHGTWEWQAYADEYFEKKGVKKIPESRMGGLGNWFYLMGEPETQRAKNGIS